MVIGSVRMGEYVVSDDLEKARRQWANRSLFRPQRRRHRWLWLVVMAAVVAVALRYSEQLAILFAV